MCGIYATNIPYQKEEVLRKLKLIKFRGPDNTSYEKIGGISMGHLRLSILDLDVRSNQPFTYKNLKIVYNGEIYNFKEIKKELIDLGYAFNTTSDTEVLIIGYYAWGKEILDKLNGMFAFAIYDSEKEEIFCVRDRLGVKPFYYYWKDGEFEICSQIQPLINKKSKVCEKALSIYLDCGYVPSPFSILENVYKLPPGHLLIIDLKTKTKFQNEYWNLRKIKAKKIEYKEAKEQLHTLLKDAVKIRLQSDVPLGTFLSGGVDSALITALASAISINKINTYTIGFKDPKYNESDLAEAYSEILGTNQTTTLCDIKDIIELIPKLTEVYGEPFADSSALPSMLLNKKTKEHVTVALSGDAGDESFFGYGHFDKMKRYKRIERLPFYLRFFLAKLPWHKILGTRPETIPNMLMAKNSKDFAEKIFTGFQTLQKNKYTDWLSNYGDLFKKSPSSLQQLADLNIKLWLENDSNVKVDRASMGSSVEIRSPFMDYRLIEFSRILPIKYRYKKRILKDILTEYLPEDLFNAPKKGFSIPIGKWIREDLKEDFLNELSDDFLKQVPNFNIDLFKKQFNDHMSGKHDYSFNIWKLYVLSKWYKNLKHLKKEMV